MPLPESAALTRRQEKRQQERMEQIRIEMRKRLDRKRAEKQKRFVPPPPRYDEVYFEGLTLLDSLAGEPITPHECVMEVSPDVWKSKARYDPDLP
jgi:hypothetical protein